MGRGLDMAICIICENKLMNCDCSSEAVELYYLTEKFEKLRAENEDLEERFTKLKLTTAKQIQLLQKKNEDIRGEFEENQEMIRDLAHRLAESW